MKIPYNTMYRVVEKLRLNLYLSASTVKLERVVELNEVYVTAGFKGKKGLKGFREGRGLKRCGRGTYAAKRKRNNSNPLKEGYAHTTAKEYTKTPKTRPTHNK